MKWYVLWHDFNTDKIETFNIFTSSKFSDGVKDLIKHYTTFNDFKEKLERLLLYCFWSKAEYEIMCSGLFDGCKEYKVDIYQQVIPNLDILARYIISEANKRKRKKLIID